MELWVCGMESWVCVERGYGVKGMCRERVWS